ncbi:MAG TPA: DJ-1/PfpI family protein [Usitatibacter sp.]|jgi:transcriptional regulator GlxA family with amidase domain|nr:DJ-1/PfpI family protein [Usitatibacter sp.]
MGLERIGAMLACIAAIGFARADNVLKPPARGPITVAFVLTESANVIDFAGAWEVFQDTARPGTEEPGFRLFTVSEGRKPLTLTGGLKVLPDYTFDDAPAADVVVVGAQGGSPKLDPRLRKVAADARTQVLMSVCTGAFKLAGAGLLDGKRATTHHDFHDAFAKRFPRVQLEREARYVEAGPHLFTAGGLTSGIDLALHIVERFYGQDAARLTAAYMEYRRAPA